jgi:hypothetical protein
MVRNPQGSRCHRHGFLLVKLADGVLRDEDLIQGREVGDHAVNAGDRGDAEDGRGGDSQQQFAAFGLGALVRRQQRTQPGRIAELGPGHVGHQAPVPVRGCLQQGRPQLQALVMSISSGAVMTGTPLTTSKGNLPSCICVTAWHLRHRLGPRTLLLNAAAAGRAAVPIVAHGRDGVG